MIDCRGRYVIAQVNAVSPIDMDFYSSMQEHMSDLMGDRKSLPVGVMEGIHANYYMVFIPIYHARDIPIKGGVAHLRTEFLSESLDWDRRFYYFIVFQQVPNEFLNPRIRHEASLLSPL